MDLDTLYAGATAGDTDAIVELEKKADRLDKDGRTILHIESLYGNTERVRCIVMKLAHKNLLVKLDAFKQTALHLAADSGHTEVVEVLIDAARRLPFSVNDDLPKPVGNCFETFVRQADVQMNTALHLAVTHNHMAIAKLLVEADPDDRHIQNCNGETPMYLAAKLGYNHIVKLICKTCTAPSFDGPHGTTGLHPVRKDILYAGATAGATEAIVQLEKKADRLNRDGRTILHIESMYGNTERVRCIVMKLAHKNLLVKVDAFKQTALHLAANSGHTEVVKVLIDAARRLPFSVNDDLHKPVGNCFEAFVRQADDKMNTALHLAVSNYHMAIAKLLVEADPSDRHIKNHNDETPMYLAAKLGYNNIVKLICTACTAPSFDGPHGTTALHPVIQKLHQAKREDRDVAMVLINAAKRSACSEDAAYNNFEALFSTTDENGYNVLQLAVQGNQLDAVELILKEDPAYQQGRSSKTNDLKSLIYIAAEKRYTDIVRLLCKPYEARNELGRKGQTSLQAAIISRDKGFVYSLLGDDGELVRCEDDRGWTPLHYAAYYKFDTVLFMILETQNTVAYEFVARENVPPPVFVAIEQGHTSTVIEYLRSLPSQAPADVNYKNENILHIMASQSNKEMIKAVLNYASRNYLNMILNQKDKDGNTPLHVLVRQDCYVPELIKDVRVDKNAKNNLGYTPIDMLYSHDKITDDQVRIKIEIDKTRAKQDWKFWQRSIRKPTLENESAVPAGTRNKKESKFMEEEIKRKKNEYKLVKDDLERYRQRTNTQIIVTALITTVTFTVGFTMPGGNFDDGEDQGLVIHSKKTSFKAFMVSDALTLVLSTSSLFLYFIASLYDDPNQVSKLNAASTVFNIVSLIGMMITFVTGTYVVLSPSPALAITVCLVCCFFFILVIFQLTKLIYDRTLEKIHIV